MFESTIEPFTLVMTLILGIQLGHAIFVEISHENYHKIQRIFTLIIVLMAVSSLWLRHL